MLCIEGVTRGRAGDFTSSVWGAREEDIDTIKGIGNPLPRAGYIGVGIARRVEKFGLDCGIALGAGKSIGTDAAEGLVVAPGDRDKDNNNGVNPIFNPSLSS